MKYYYDFEFLEGDIPQQINGIDIPRWLSRPNNTIQPISVGIVAEDNREFYAISKDFNLEEAWNRYDIKDTDKSDLPGINRSQEKVYWIRENVLKPIFIELAIKDLSKTEVDYDIEKYWKDKIGDRMTFTYLKELINKYGKSNKQIAKEIIEFVYPDYNTISIIKKAEDVHITLFPSGNWVEKDYLNPTFIGYYSAYDHVVLCQLFGKMIDLPEGFPMYTIDLKQEFDRIQNKYKEDNIDFSLKEDSNYPQQDNEHSALDDARFNKNLHEFLLRYNG